MSASAKAEITVTPAAKGYDIVITEQASASELIDAIVSATGVEVKGEPEDTPVAPNHLKNSSLERALRSLLPHAAFVVRSDEDDTPETIIFMSASTGSSSDTSDGAEDNSGSDAGDASASDGSDDQSGGAADGAPEDVTPADNTPSGG